MEAGTRGLTMHILEEWRIRDIEQKAERASSRLYEIDSINRNVGSLEHSIGEIRIECDGLRSELQAQADRMRAIEDRLDRLELGD